MAPRRTSQHRKSAKYAGGRNIASIAKAADEPVARQFRDLLDLAFAFHLDPGLFVQLNDHMVFADDDESSRCFHFRQRVARKL